MLLAVPPKQSVLAPVIIERLGQLGYRDGKSATLLFRSADGAPDPFPQLARELIDAKCDLIFAIGPEHAAKALKAARASTPVVFFANDYDPLQAGVIDSLARPGSNITGVYVPEPELVAKRFEIIREAIPRARRMLLFSDPFTRNHLDAARKAAAAAGFELTVVEFSKPPYNLARVLEEHAKTDVLMVLTSPALFAELASPRAPLVKYRIASIGTGGFADRGLLFGFGAVVRQGLRRTAEMGAAILQGTSPASIPVEQPREFDFVINSKTASELGSKIPEAILARATRIIQ